MRSRETNEIDRESFLLEEQLPEGWTVASLGQVSYARLGKTPRRSDYRNEGIHRMVKFRDLRSRGVDYSSSKAGYVVNTPNALKGLRPLQLGDVLVTASAHSGEQIGRKCAYVNKIPDVEGGVYFVGELLGITTDSRVMHSKWPYFWFLSEDGVATIQSAVAGVHLTAGRAQKIPIPLPPLPEQQRIVAKVEELLARVNAARQRLAKAPVILKRFRQAVLAAACSGRLTEDWRKNHQVTPVNETIHEILQNRNKKWPLHAESRKKYTPPREVSMDTLPELPEGWKYISSDALFHFVTSGSRGWAKYYASSGPIFIRVGNLDHDSIELDLTSVQNVDPPANLERERTRVTTGDILISITADVGMVGLVPEDIPEAYVNQHVAIARPVDAGNREYLAWFLACPSGGQIQFQELQRGATKAGLGLDDIRSVAVPFPPLEEQQEIVRRIRRLFIFADLIKKRLTLAKSRVDGLNESVLAKAFRGELVSTEAELARQEGRPYESAGHLLERIRKELQISTEIAGKEGASTMARRIKASKPSARRELIGVLAESKQRLTPDELFRQAGFDEDSVEEFYEELRSGMAAGKIAEKRPNNTDVFLEAVAP